MKSRGKKNYKDSLNKNTKWCNRCESGKKIEETPKFL